MNRIINTRLWSFVTKSVIALVMLFSFLGLLHVSAQTGGTDVNTVSESEIYAVYVENLKVDKNSYSSGDTVNGTFTLSNRMSKVVTNIYYDVKLAGEYENEIPANFYEIKTGGGPITLSPGQSENIGFSYKLPNTIAGPLGIQIQAHLQSGALLGFADAQFSVAGQNNFVSITSVELLYDGKSFGPNEGPTLKKDVPAKMLVNLALPSTNNSSTVVVPKVSYYNRSVYNQELSSVTLPDVNLTTSVRSAKVEFDVPRFNDSAAVYVGKLSFYNKAGEKISSDTIFRYIIGGSIVNINSVSVDKQSFSKGDSFNLSLKYTGSPRDITSTEPRSSDKKYEIDLVVASEQNQRVAEYSGMITDLPGETELIIPFVASSDAKAVSILVTVKDDGKIIASYQAALAEGVSVEDEKTVSGVNWSIYGLVFVLLVLILGLLLVTTRRGKNNDVVMTALVALFITAGFLSVTDSVYAWDNVSQSSSAQCYQGNCVPTIAPNNIPIKNGEYAPSTQVTLSGSISQIACDNNDRGIRVYASNTNGNWTKIYEKTKGAHKGNNYYQYSAKRTLASTPGDHFVYLKVETYEDIGGGVFPTNPQGVKVIRQPYKIVAPAANGVCNPTATTAGSSAPTAPLCSVGTASTVTGSGPWSWTCAGTGSGTTASCTRSLPGGGGQSGGGGNDGGSNGSGPVDEPDLGGLIIGEYIGAPGSQIQYVNDQAKICEITIELNPTYPGECKLYRFSGADLNISETFATSTEQSVTVDFEVSPTEDYKVICTETVSGRTDTTEVLKCVLNPTIEEQ